MKYDQKFNNMGVYMKGFFPPVSADIWWFQTTPWCCSLEVVGKIAKTSGHQKEEGREIEEV